MNLFGVNKSPVDVISEGDLEEHILEIFIRVLMASGIVIVGKSL